MGVALGQADGGQANRSPRSRDASHAVSQSAGSRTTSPQHEDRDDGNDPGAIAIGQTAAVGRLGTWWRESWARAEAEATDDWEHRSPASKAGGCLNQGCGIAGCLPWLLGACVGGVGARRLLQRRAA